VLLAYVAASGAVAVLPEMAIGEGVVARPVKELADRRIVIALRTGTARRRALTVVVEALRRAAGEQLG
jgi:DNA-binding transcriptional LysR family regulator